MSKRKCEFTSEESSAPFAKQLKSIPFPGFEMDVDVAMSDASSDFGSALNSPEAYHSRLASNVSTNSSGSVDNTPAVADLSAQNIGLLQPSSSFKHHGTGCQQIPKLRIACSPGLNGSRTMWSFCEECGAISQVDSD
ncbi:hypothetical protein FIBSPDRAFT_906428 [Athelia psychrophila]|uniref:Uncharacterized protein n=1 Tax=Athelia psychrophila TaxID=1759441 RepID=A0A166X0K9_9AGAM|nr:hypothetical protein FIBSPDRAFT_906428 [Fibularhizoctonia sp. CBS 109695]